MAKHINFKTCNNSMMKRLLILTILLLSMLSVSYSYNLDEVMRWEFETGHGNVLLDSSGNGNNGLFVGADFDANEKFGLYSLKFDGNDDYAYSITPIPLYEQMTFSFWVYRQDNDDDRMLFTIRDTSQQHFKILYNRVQSTTKIYYTDNVGTPYTISVPSSSIPKEVWTKITFSIDYEDNRFLLYIDNTLKYNATTPNTFVDIDEDNEILLGTITSGVDGFKGLIDSFRYFNFVLNTTQISQLDNNTITYNESETIGNETGETPETPTETIQDEIIVQTNPINNQNVNNPVRISFVTSIGADCDLYLDNDFVEEYDNVISGSYTETLSEGLHSYLLYCYYYDNEDKLVFDITNTTYFNVTTLDEMQVYFQLTGVDYDITQESLYLVSPCMNRGISAIGTDIMPYKSESNPNGIKFAKFENGIAEMSVYSGTNEFCIFNGRVIYNEDNRTTNYDIMTSHKQMRIGNIEIPNNVTQTYSLTLERYEIYDVTNPKAFNLTWASVIGGVILSMFAILLILVGVSSGQPKVTLAGVLVLLSAFGVSFTGLVLGAIF